MILDLINKIDDGLEEHEWDMICNELNCCVVEVKAPRFAKGWTVNRGLGNIIYINSLLSDEKKKDVLKHELGHILDDDFRSGKNITIKESTGVKYGAI